MVLGVCLDFVVGLVLGIWFGFWLWVLDFGCFQCGLIWLGCFEVLVFGVWVCFALWFSVW